MDRNNLYMIIEPGKGQTPLLGKRERKERKVKKTAAFVISVAAAIEPGRCNVIR
jgi:hypothetical protein